MVSKNHETSYNSFFYLFEVQTAYNLTFSLCDCSFFFFFFFLFFLFFFFFFLFFLIFFGLDEKSRFKFEVTKNFKGRSATETVLVRTLTSTWTTILTLSTTSLFFSCCHISQTQRVFFFFFFGVFFFFFFFFFLKI